MDKRGLSQSADLLRLSTLGLNFVLCTLAGLGLGLLVRKYLHTGNWAVIGGILFGVLASYVVLFKDLKRLNRDMDQDPPEK